MLVILVSNRDEIKKLLQARDLEPVSRRNDTVQQLARRPSSTERRASFVARSERLEYLSSQIEILTPEAWWIGPLQVWLRLAQTSAMVLVTRQSVRAALASCVSIVGVRVHRELAPYRSPSDNRTSVLAQAVIFVWCFSLVLRDTGLFDWLPVLVIGVLLLVMTLGVVVHVAWAARSEMRAAREMEQQQTRHAGTSPQTDEMLREGNAKSTQDHAPSDEGKSEDGRAMSSGAAGGEGAGSSWSLSCEALLCSEQHQENEEERSTRPIPEKTQPNTESR